MKTETEFGFFHVEYKRRGHDWEAIYAPFRFNLMQPGLAPEAAALAEARAQIASSRQGMPKSYQWRIVRTIVRETRSTLNLSA